MRNVIVHIHPDDGQEARLQAALDVVRAFEGHLTCLQVTPYYTYVASDPFGGVYMMGDLLEAQNKRDEDERATIEARLQREGVSWDWRHFDGDPAQSIVSAARLADLIVLSRALRLPEPNEPMPIIADISINARAPVLAMPPEAKRFDLGGVAAIAWNGSFEAAQALRFAVPLLAKASSVRVLTVVDDMKEFPATDACTYLSRHGIEPELDEIGCEGRVVVDALLAGISSAGASYVVMGAYGHSRVHEYLFGGVTRAMLGRSPVPLILAH